MGYSWERMATHRLWKRAQPVIQQLSSMQPISQQEATSQILESPEAPTKTAAIHSATQELAQLGLCHSCSSRKLLWADRSQSTQCFPGSGSRYRSMCVPPPPSRKFLLAMVCKGEEKILGTYRGPRRHQVTLVQDENEMFPGLLLLQVALHMGRSGTHWVSRIQHLHHYI